MIGLYGGGGLVGLPFVVEVASASRLLNCFDPCPLKILEAVLLPF